MGGVCGIVNNMLLGYMQVVRKFLKELLRAAFRVFCDAGRTIFISTRKHAHVVCSAISEKKMLLSE